MSPAQLKKVTISAILIVITINHTRRKMDATKKDLTGAIFKHCKNCSGNKAQDCILKDCALWPYRSVNSAVQLDIFRVYDKDIFLGRVLDVAKTWGQQPFFWSELRSMVNMRPLHDNWWGVSTRVLQKHGFRVVDGARRSTHKSRCGAIDRHWQKLY